MSVVPAAEAERHDLHGATFRSFVRPRTGSTQLCAWRLDVAAGTAGDVHTVSHEEVLLVLEGSFLVHLDDVVHPAVAGDVVHVPAGSSFGVDTGAEPGSAWVTTSVGLEAVLADGSRLRPPWTL